MEKAQFNQILLPDDLIAYNCYIATKRSRASIMTRVLGVFLIILGVIDLFKENPQYITCILVIAMGVFGAVFLNPLMLISQKKMIRKKITSEYPPIPMDVTINEEGITFEIPIEEEQTEEPVRYDDGDIHIVTPIEDIPTNNEMREEEYHSEEVQEETEVDSSETAQEEQVVETSDDAQEQAETSEEVQEQEEQKPQKNILPIPWAAIKSIEDDGKYMYINMAGYQALIIKKDSCENIEDIVEYCKSKLTKPTSYKETKKQNDHE